MSAEPEAIDSALETIIQTFTAQGGMPAGGPAETITRRAARDGAEGFAAALETVIEGGSGGGGSGPAAAPVERLPRMLRASGQAGAEAALDVLRPLGQGGMGRVELAVQRSLGREVAVKTLRPDVPQKDAARAALLQEAAFTGYLQHPNIVPVHELGRDEQDEPVLVMKRIEGHAWRELIRDPAHPFFAGREGEDRLRDHLEILKAVANAIHFAHTRGVIHRDLKPENVMIGDFGEVYVLDWGLATRLGPGAPESNAIVGTPAYMAPEMLDGTAALGERTDVYLLGACLHEVLTRTTPHAGDSPQNVLMSVYRSAPHDYPASVPAELADLCNRSMHRDPAERPESALAFRRELEAFIRHRGSIELSDQAAETLGRLRARLAEPDPDPADSTDRESPTALFHECRFGFVAALRDWPQNEAARTGLQACLELMIERELERGNAGFAETLLAELPEPRPALIERLSALRTRLAEQAQASDRLRALQTDLDARVGGRQRARLLLALGLLGGTAAHTVAWLGRRGAIDLLSYRTGIAGVAGLFVVFATALILGRRSLLGTTFNRRFSAGALTIIGSILTHRVIGWWLDVPIHHTIVNDVVVVSTGVTVMAIALDRRMLPIGLASFASAGVGAAIPDYALEIFATGLMIGFFTAATIWSRGATDLAPQPDASDAAGDRPR